MYKILHISGGKNEINIVFKMEEILFHRYASNFQIIYNRHLLKLIIKEDTVLIIANTGYLMLTL